MKHTYIGIVLACTSLLAACGGGSSSGSSGGSTTQSGSGSTNDVATVTVSPGPADPSDQTFNIPTVSVQICQSGQCATISNVLVDTGSSGLRLIASAVQNAGLNLTPMADTANPGNSFYECLPFADGYSWGTVAQVTATVGGETTGEAIPVQVIGAGSASAPSDCTSWGATEQTVDDFDANGVLGVSVFAQDCGPTCVCASACQGLSYDSSNNTQSGNTIYYSCGSSSCNAASMPLASQVLNPVTTFPVDNNGVILELQSIPSTGQATASGTLIFGIGTESNNSLGSATVLTVNDEGNFSTQFDSQSLPESFLDSGSNGLYFPDTSLMACPGQDQSSGNYFYCPSSTTTLSATNQGQNGTQSSVSFMVANLDDINTSYWAIDDVGGSAPASNTLSGYFDWGLPFFYGRSIYTAIQGAKIGDTVYEDGFYAY